MERLPSQFTIPLLGKGGVRGWFGQLPNRFQRWWTEPPLTPPLPRRGILLIFIVALIVICAMARLSTALQQNAPVSFSDIAAQAGINFKHENGASPQKYLPETMGAG